MADPPSISLRILDERLRAWGFPRRGSAGAAGIDLHACLPEPLRLEPGSAAVLIGAGFALRIADPGWCGLVAPRSGLGHRGLVLGNGVGIVDSDYRGPVTVSAWNRNAPGSDAITIEPGDRIAQLLFVPAARPDLEIVDAFEDATDRGGGGFGSTGTAPALPHAP